MDIRDKKGSIALFVMIGMVFMSSFLLISYSNNLNKSKIVKEQYNMISSIYYKNESDQNVYNVVYSELRENTKEIKDVTIDGSTIFTIRNTYDAPIENYKIYANSSGLGKLNNGKYEIAINVYSGKNKSKTYYIYLKNSMRTNEYLDYETQRVVSASGTTKEMVELPIIYTYEGDASFNITNGGTPSKVLLKYVGY